MQMNYYLTATIKRSHEARLSVDSDACRLCIRIPLRDWRVLGPRTSTLELGSFGRSNSEQLIPARQRIET